MAAWAWVVVFDVPADSCARFTGRSSEPLAVQFAELADDGLVSGYCGTGALTAQLVQRGRHPDVGGGHRGVGPAVLAGVGCALDLIARSRSSAGAI